MYRVYLIENLINGKRYVGITGTTVERRFARHQTCARGAHPKCLVHKAMKKYGVNSFTCTELLTVNTAGEAKQMEVALIASYQTFYVDHPTKGYNMTRGGDGMHGYVPTEETRQKLRLVNLGRTYSQQHRQNIANSKIGVPRPPHVQTILTECRMRHCGSNAVGSNNPNARRWILTNANTGEIIHVDDIKDWCRQRGWKISSVYAAASAGNLYKRQWAIQSVRD
jgi:group I intron endonuclease